MCMEGLIASFKHRPKDCWGQLLTRSFFCDWWNVFYLSVTTNILVTIQLRFAAYLRLLPVEMVVQSFLSAMHYGRMHLWMSHHSARCSTFGGLLFTAVAYSSGQLEVLTHWTVDPFCLAVQYSRSAVQYGSMYCRTVQYSVVQCSTVVYSSVQRSAMQYSVVQYSSAQCSVMQYSEVQ
jgi:hypothetical protein